MIIKQYLPKEFDKLEKYWRELETGEEMTVFQSFDWYRMINNNYLQSKVLRLLCRGFYILVLDNDEKPVLIAPLMIQSIGLGGKFPRAIYFLGRETCTDYFNFIYKKINVELLNTCLSYIKANLNCAKFCFSRVLETTTLYNLINETYHCVGERGECVALEIPSSFDDFYITLSKSTKQNYRTCLNRLKKDEVTIEINTVDNVEKNLRDEINTLHKQRLKIKHKEERKEMSFFGVLYNTVIRFFSKPLPLLDEFPSLWVTYARDTSNRLIYFFYGPYDKKNETVRLLFTGLHESCYNYSLGVNIWIMYLKKAFEEKTPQIRCLDFTRGAEEYKFRIGGKCHYIHTLQFEV